MSIIQWEKSKILIRNIEIISLAINWHIKHSHLEPPFFFVCLLTSFCSSIFYLWIKFLLHFRFDFWYIYLVVTFRISSFFFVFRFLQLSFSSFPCFIRILFVHLFGNSGFSDQHRVLTLSIFCSFSFSFLFCCCSFTIYYYTKFIQIYMSLIWLCVCVCVCINQSVFVLHRLFT